MKTPVFKGSCTAIVTPFGEHGIDYERLGRNLDFQYENGTAAVVVCGTTGENATLSGDEHQELVRVTLRENAGRMKVIVGVGSNNTLAALKKAEGAKAAGADAILMVTENDARGKFRTARTKEKQHKCSFSSVQSLSRVRLFATP